jgi:hypothetical protein
LKDGGRRDRRKLKIGKSLSCIPSRTASFEDGKLLETLRRGATRKNGNHAPILSTFLRFLLPSALKLFPLFAGCFGAEC